MYSYNKIIPMEVGMVNGLAYTSLGGDILPIETTKYKSSEKLLLTGQLGEVMNESISCAYSYVKANAKKFKINENDFKDITLHMHFPEGAIKKDGPSAGIAITTALISLFKNVKINYNIAFTGEVTITGRVLKIGGLKEKVLGAIRSGIKTIFIPKSNEMDLEEIKKILDIEVDFILVENYIEIYDCLFGRK